MKYNINIEKGIPIPRGRTPTQDGTIRALRDMKKGDSFTWEGKSISNVYIYSKMAGVKVLVRTQPDGKKRVWRVE